MAVVFVGRVLMVVEGEWIQDRLWKLDESYGSTVALLEIELTWQGPERRYAVVIGGSSQGDCILHFAPGAKYLIRVVDDEYGPLYTNTCIGARQIAVEP